MTPTRRDRPPRFIVGAIAIALASTLAHGASPAAPAARAADDEAGLPDSLRRGYVAPVTGPRDDERYARGALGIVPASYGRASLYVAWRVMQLPPGALASESHRRQGDWVRGASPAAASAQGDELAAWSALRAQVLAEPPAIAPDYFRTSMRKTTLPGGASFDMKTSTATCGPDAYAFATRTLQGLLDAPAVTEAARRRWAADQDAVFGQCAWTAAMGPRPALPAPLPAAAPAGLKALRDYQHAAARFYSEDFDGARPEFDAIAATPGHPMRAWAALGALRAVVRSASMDPAWDAAVSDVIWGRGLAADQIRAALAEPRARHQALVDAALPEIERRVGAILGDAALAPVHGATRYTVRRAVMQFRPAAVMMTMMQALDRPADNPYRLDTLSSWNELHRRSVPDHPDAQAMAVLRKHAFYDWILTVQACDDAPGAPGAATCAEEHGHAVAQWRQARTNDWLLATLMTARSATPDALDAAEKARAVAAERPETPSLRFYAARVLRLAGRRDDAQALLDGLAAMPSLDKTQRDLLERERRAP